MPKFKFPIQITFIALLVIFCAPFKSTSFGMWPFSEVEHPTLARARGIYNIFLDNPNTYPERIEKKVSKLLFEELWRKEQNNRQNKITRVLGIAAGVITAGAIAMREENIKYLSPCETAINLLTASIIGGFIGVMWFKKIFANLIYDRSLFNSEALPSLLDTNDYQELTKVNLKMEEYDNITKCQDIRMNLICPLANLVSVSLSFGLQLLMGGFILEKIANLNSVLFVSSIIYGHALIPLSFRESLVLGCYMGLSINSILWNERYSAETPEVCRKKTIVIGRKRYNLKGFRALLKK